MAKTAVVNPKRRKRHRRSNPKRRRRHNYGAAAAINPRRRRRRRAYYGSHHKRRRRNPVSVYSSGGYYRKPNPSTFSLDEITEVVPAATAGIWACRFALKQAGAFEPAKDGVLEPGVKHAIALYLGAVFGGQLTASLMGSEEKGRMARIAGLGFAGDLFLRTRFMRDSEFVQKNLSLQGMGDEDDGGYMLPDDMGGFSTASPIGAAPTMVDAFGNQFVSTPTGWQLAGGVGEYVQDASGNVYELSGDNAGGAALAGFSTQSPLGYATKGSGYMYRANSQSSFGYSR